MLSGGFWPTPGTNDDDDDPVAKALRYLGQGASSVAEGVASAVSGAGQTAGGMATQVTDAATGLYDRRAAEIAAEPATPPSPLPAELPSFLPQFRAPAPELDQPSPYDTDQPFRPTPRLGQPPAPVPVAADYGPIRDPNDTRADDLGRHEALPAPPRPPGYETSPFEGALNALAPVVGAYDAVNEWAINNPVVGALNPQAWGRELAGTEQVYAETREDQQRYEALLRRFRAGDASVEPDLLALQDSLNRRTRADRASLLAAGERNPDKTGETLGQIVQAGATMAIAPSLAAGPVRNVVGAALDPLGQGLGAGVELAGRGLGVARGALDANAARVAAADARMAAADPAYAATLIVPEGSPVRARRVRAAPPMDLSEAESPAFARTAEELGQGRAGADSPEALDPSHPLEWHDVTVRINNKGDYDGDHAVSLPFFRNGQGDLIPLEPADVGPMGSPVNSAYNAAVKAAGGRKGFVYGRWRDARGVRHEFDSPQEVVAMVDLDARLDEGAIDGWWSQANNPFPQLQRIPYASTNRDKGGLKAYVPDLIVRHHDGSLEVIEIKSPEVIAKAEEYGMKAGEVSGLMGWGVVTKAAGIIAGLADQGVRYRLMLPHQVLETGRIPLGPNVAGQGARSRRLDLLPGVDPRDAPKMRKKKITPAAGSPGVEIARVVDETSSVLMEEAARLKAAGVPDDERLRLLTRKARDELLPTADLAVSAPVPAAAVARGEPPAPTTPGRQEGLNRLLAASGEAPVGSWVGHRGPLGIDDLDEVDPSSARILREAEDDGGRVTGLAVHERGDGTTQLLYDIDGDPQAAIRAGGRLAIHHGADEASRGIWYRDAKGRYPVGGLDLELPGGDFDAIRAAIAEAVPDAGMVVPRYNSERVLEGLDLYGRAADGTPLRAEVLDAALDRARRVLESQGLGSRVGPMQRAEISRFVGEPGHASSPEAAVERAEQVLGRRRISLEAVDAAQAEKRAAAAAQRAADRAGAGGGETAAVSGAARPAAGAPSEAAGGRLGVAPDLEAVDDLEDLLDEDDLLDAGVSLLGPYPSARGRAAAATSTLAGRALTTAGQSLAGGVSGAYLGAGAPAETDEERRRNALAGAGLGLVGGPLASRGIGAIQRRSGSRAGGALSTLGAVPEGSRYDPRLAREPVLPGMEPPRRTEQIPSISDAPNRPPVLGDVPPSAIREPVLPGMEPPAPAPLGQAVETMLGPAAEGAPPPSIAGQLPGMPPPKGPNFWEWLKKIGYTGMLGPTTAASQMVGGAVQTGLAVEKAIARAVAEGRPGSAGRIVGASIGAVPEGFRSLFKVVLGNEAEPGISAAWGGGTARMADRVQNPIGAAVARALDYSTELWTQAPDALFSPIFRAIGEREAAEQVAKRTGGSADQLLADAATARQAGTGAASSEVEDVMKAGQTLADDLGFRGDPGAVGKKLAALAARNDAVGFLASFLLPFPSMTARSLKATGRLVPGVGEWIGRREGRDAFERLHDQMVGPLGVAAMGYYAAQGGLTGGGPVDKGKRDQLAAAGWQPHSVLVPGVGYVPTRYFQQWAPILDAVGEVHDAFAYGKKGVDPAVVLGDVATRAGKLASDQVGLGQLNDLLQVLDGSQSGSQVAGFAARSLSRYIPFGATLRQTASVIDPTARRPVGREPGEIVPVTSFVQNLEQGIPGLRGRVPARQDVLGRAMPNPQRGLQPAMRTEPMLRAFERAGLGVGDPPETIKNPDTGDERALTAAQQARWRTAYGRALRSGWSDNGSPTDKETLGAVKRAARDEADALVLGR